MAPSGYKTFSAGAVLTATADVQNYLMDQVVTVHDDASARSSAISSPAEGQVSYLKDTNKVYLYNASAWAEVGGGVTWSGSTANGLATYGSASSIVAESTATYDGTTLQLTTSGGGLKLDNLNSSNANTLDDYEFGDWTATVTAASGTLTLNSSYNTGTYIKIGKVVHIQGQLIMTSVSSPSGLLSVGGLPFAAASLTGEKDVSTNLATAVSLASAVAGIWTYIGQGHSTFSFRGGAGETTNDSSIADKFDGGTEILVGGSYRTA
jgi:hypothetical protein